MKKNFTSKMTFIDIPTIKRNINDEKTRRIYDGLRNYPMNLFKLIFTSKSSYTNASDYKEHLFFILSFYALDKCDINHKDSNGKTIVQYVYDFFMNYKDKALIFEETISFLRRISKMGFNQRIETVQSNFEKVKKLNYEVSCMNGEVPATGKYTNYIYLSQGGFGTVSTVRDGPNLAVIKTVLDVNNTRDIYKEYLTSKGSHQDCVIEMYEIKDKIQGGVKVVELVTEYCPLILWDYMEFFRDYPLEFIYDKFYQLFKSGVETLGNFNKRGRLHCDIKPENLGVLNGKIKLLDFGLAEHLGVFRRVKKGLAGTIVYMPPEYLKRDVSNFHRDNINNKPQLSTDYYTLFMSYIELFGYNFLVFMIPRKDIIIEYYLDVNRAVSGIELLNSDIQNVIDFLQSKNRYFKDLLIRSLCNDPDLRLDAYQALSHQYFGGQGVFFPDLCSFSEVLQGVLENEDVLSKKTLYDTHSIFYEEYKDFVLVSNENNKNITHNSKSIDFIVNIKNVLSKRSPKITNYLNKYGTDIPKNVSDTFQFLLGNQVYVKENDLEFLELFCENNNQLIPMSELIKSFIEMMNMKSFPSYVLHSFSEKIEDTILTFFSEPGTKTIGDLFEDLFFSEQEIYNYYDEDTDINYDEKASRIYYDRYEPEEDEFLTPLAKKILNLDINFNYSQNLFFADRMTYKIGEKNLLIRELSILRHFDNFSSGIVPKADFTNIYQPDPSDLSYIKLKNISMTWRNLNSLMCYDINKQVNMFKNILKIVLFYNNLGFINLDINPDTILITEDGKPLIGSNDKAIFAGVTRNIKNYYDNVNYSPPEQSNLHTIYNGNKIFFQTDKKSEITYSIDSYSVCLSFLKLFFGLDERVKIFSEWNTFLISKDHKITVFTEEMNEKLHSIPGLYEVLMQGLILNWKTRKTAKQLSCLPFFTDVKIPLPLPYSISNYNSFDYSSREILQKVGNLSLIDEIENTYELENEDDPDLMNDLYSSNIFSEDQVRDFQKNTIYPSKTRKMIGIIDLMISGLYTIDEIELKIKEIKPKPKINEVIMENSEI